MPNFIDNARDFLKKILDEGEVRIQFIKKSGESREMRCTLDFKKIPKEKRPSRLDLPRILKEIQSGHLRVFDLDKMEWRTVSYNTVEYLKTVDNKIFFIKR